MGEAECALWVAHRLSNDGRLAATNVHCQAGALRSAINLDVHLDGVDNGVLSLPRGCLGRVHHGLHLLKVHIFQSNTHLILAGVFENLMAGAKALEQRLPLISTGKPRSHIADCVLRNHRCHTRSPEVWFGAQIRSRAPVFEPNTTCGGWIPAKFTAQLPPRSNGADPADRVHRIIAAAVIAVTGSRSPRRRLMRTVNLCFGKT